MNKIQTKAVSALTCFSLLSGFAVLVNGAEPGSQTIVSEPFGIYDAVPEISDSNRLTLHGKLNLPEYSVTVQFGNLAFYHKEKFNPYSNSYSVDSSVSSDCPNDYTYDCWCACPFNSGYFDESADSKDNSLPVNGGIRNDLIIVTNNSNYPVDVTITAAPTSYYKNYLCYRLDNKYPNDPSGERKINKVFTLNTSDSAHKITGTNAPPESRETVLRPITAGTGRWTVEHAMRSQDNLGRNGCTGNVSVLIEPYGGTVKEPSYNQYPPSQ